MQCSCENNTKRCYFFGTKLHGKLYCLIIFFFSPYYFWLSFARVFLMFFLCSSLSSVMSLGKQNKGVQHMQSHSETEINLIYLRTFSP